jgi:DNA modification methylase
MGTTKDLKIVIKNIDELKVYENNPRKNDQAVDAVANSIKEFGFKVPIIITKDNVIIAGHTRIKACKKLGITDVPCIIADDLSEDQIRAFRLADNRASELADWDLEKLKVEFDSIELDLDLFGFEELQKKLSDDSEDDDFDESEVFSENPYSKKGDIFELNEHRVMCGDSTDIETVKSLTNNRLADMIFTDPPYNVDYEGATGMKIQNDKQNDGDFLNFLSQAFKNMADQLKSGGAVYCCHADTEGLNFRTAFKGAGLKLSECLVWVKNSLVLGRQDYHWRHEPILYGWKEGESHYFAEDRTQDTVWEYNKPKANDLHPTMKPIPLVARAISNSSRKGETILDLFGGSGTTLIACEELNRKALLMELDERYVDVIIKRYIRLVQSSANCFLLRDGQKTPLSEITDYSLENQIIITL